MAFFTFSIINGSNVDLFILGFTSLVAAIVSFFLGWIWYGPLFGKTWMRLNKVKMSGKPKGMGKMMLLSFIGSWITASVLAGLISTFDFSAFNAIGLAIWMWLGFFATTTLLGSVLWDGKPWGLFVLNGAYWLINLVVMAAVISLWWA
jgi:hypothetical protein